MDYIQRTTITWCHRYDRKDPSIVAISLSPEETLLLGLFFLPKKFILLNDSGVHSVDFSNVRDDKCHVGVGQSRVRSIKQMSPNPYNFFLR